MNPDTNKFEELSNIIEEKFKEKFIDLNDRAKEAIIEGKFKDQLFCPDGTPVPKHWTVLTIGENVVIKDYTFKVAYINETTLVLEPVEVPIIGKDKE